MIKAVKDLLITFHYLVEEMWDIRKQLQDGIIGNNVDMLTDDANIKIPTKLVKRTGIHLIADMSFGMRNLKHAEMKKVFATKKSLAAFLWQYFKSDYSPDDK